MQVQWQELLFKFWTVERFCSTLQVDPGKYKNIMNGFKVTVKEDGARGLAKGWAPTFIGYSMQGLCKFGFYEVFKILYSNMIGEVSSENCKNLFPARKTNLSLSQKLVPAKHKKSPVN